MVDTIKNMLEHNTKALPAVLPRENVFIINEGEENIKHILLTMETHTHIHYLRQNTTDGRQTGRRIICFRKI